MTSANYMDLRRSGLSLRVLEVRWAEIPGFTESKMGPRVELRSTDPFVPQGRQARAAVPTYQFMGTQYDII